MLGKPYILKKFEDGGKKLFNQGLMNNMDVRTDYTRGEAFKSHMQKFNRLVEMTRNGELDTIDYRNYVIYTFPMSGLVTPSASYGMFETLIRFTGSEEQVKEYIPKIQSNSIIGCYAQTEMGHGSDVRGLQTRATFDPKTDSFVLNTPTIKDAKFWPGELGKLATHAVVQAKTFSNGKEHGVQTFLIQIRDMDSHRPLPGLEIGDIGPKYGFATKDNGYMYFKNYVVPRSALLSRFSRMSKEGEFSVSGDPRVAYSAMMLIRIQLLEATPGFMSKGLAIALRYITSRSQFKTLPNSKDERKIIDYQASKVAIASALAFAWASRVTSFKCNGMYKKMMSEISKHKFKTMKELHSFACALKAYYCEEVVTHLKGLRELMGGHGYLVASEMPELMEMGKLFINFSNFI